MSDIPDVRETLEEFFGVLVRAGVTITFEDWQGLKPMSRSALLAARDAYRAEGVVMLATALSGREGLAWVMKQSDSGDSFVGLKLEEAVQRHMEKAGAK